MSDENAEPTAVLFGEWVFLVRDGAVLVPISALEGSTLGRSLQWIPDEASVLDGIGLGASSINAVPLGLWDEYVDADGQLR